ncbi:regulator [Marinitenerispora sediminis]|uniref:Regulator n=1 Tax=Marinitenerispora sediminis TaxID=1931232 RepID=A0A368T7H6_9ACTN|nr:regulator [Marinitenerispora sediminis]
MVAADSPLGRLVTAARPARPWLHLSVSSWWARVLIAAGAQPVPTDAMTATFTPEHASEEATDVATDPVPCGVSSPTVNARTGHIGGSHDSSGTLLGKKQRQQLGTVTPPLNTLPGLPAGLIGRGDELARLLAALDPNADDPENGASGRAVVATVTGTVGTGKTALAVATAHEAHRRGWFRTVLFVDLQGYTPGAVPVVPEQALVTLLRALDVRSPDIPPTMDEQAGLYRFLLHDLATRQDAPVLVVADNARTADQVLPLKPGPGRHRLLVTSRHAFPELGEARRVNLGVLPNQASIDLLINILAESDPDDPRTIDTEGLGELARACGHLPLTLKLAATLLTNHPRQTPRALAARLVDTSKQLDQTDLGTSSSTMQAAFDASFENLSERQAEMFVRLALNPGPDISTGGAAALAGMPTDDVEEVLADLAAAHLIRHDHESGRWSMHGLLRDYAEAQRAIRTDDSPRTAAAHEEARDRLLNFYLARAEAAIGCLRALPGDDIPVIFEGRDDALAWLDAERTNLIGIVNTIADDRPHLAVRMSAPLCEYLSWRRFLNDQLTVAAMARDAAQAIGNLQSEADAWNNLGSVLQDLHRFNEAIAALEHARDLYQQTGDSHREAAAWNNLGLTLRSVHEFSEAVIALEHARDLYQQTGDSHREAAAWNNLGLTRGTTSASHSAPSTTTTKQSLLCDTPATFTNKSAPPTARPTRGTTSASHSAPSTTTTKQSPSTSAPATSTNKSATFIAKPGRGVTSASHSTRCGRCSRRCTLSNAQRSCTRKLKTMTDETKSCSS